MEAYDNIPLPPDWQDKAEWVQARLMYPQHPDARFARFRYGRLDWREGGTSWTQDYPRADRHFAMALRRLTRIDVRSVEQPSNPELLGHLTLHRGQFQLIDNNDGTTTLIGRSWYTLHMRPLWYFDWWTRDVTSHVHLRVMEHIKTLAEGDR